MAQGGTEITDGVRKKIPDVFAACGRVVGMRASNNDAEVEVAWVWCAMGTAIQRTKHTLSKKKYLLVCKYVRVCVREKAIPKPAHSPSQFRLYNKSLMRSSQFLS